VLIGVVGRVEGSAAAVAAVMAQNTCFSQNTGPATMG